MTFLDPFLSAASAIRDPSMRHQSALNQQADKSNVVPDATTPDALVHRVPCRGRSGCDEARPRGHGCGDHRSRELGGRDAGDAARHSVRVAGVARSRCRIARTLQRAGAGACADKRDDGRRSRPPARHARRHHEGRLELRQSRRDRQRRARRGWARGARYRVRAAVDVGLLDRRDSRHDLRRVRVVHGASRLLLQPRIVRRGRRHHHHESRGDGEPHRVLGGLERARSKGPRLPAGRQSEHQHRPVRGDVERECAGDAGGRSGDQARRPRDLERDADQRARFPGGSPRQRETQARRRELSRLRRMAQRADGSLLLRWRHGVLRDRRHRARPHSGAGGGAGDPHLDHRAQREFRLRSGRSDAAALDGVRRRMGCERVWKTCASRGAGDLRVPVRQSQPAAAVAHRDRYRTTAPPVLARLLPRAIVPGGQHAPLDELEQP